jgi:outer membrane protein TolC
VSLAQTYDELLANTSTGVDFSYRLPPLAELQELAIEYSPIFKMLDADIAIGEHNVQEEKRAWMKSVGAEGGVSYGLYDNLVLTNDYGALESDFNSTEQTRYYMGAYLKIPISSIIDKSNVKAAKAEKQKLQYQRAIRIQELRQLIIVRYNNVLLHYRGMLIKSNAVESYRVQKLRADEDFKNGLINVYEFARLEDMMSKSVVDLEEAKLNFSTAFQILEETVGVKIQLKN